ncbi:sensor histidine kinase [Frateuria defendens]|uniref:sensor histidine kinase n=1 Tax=Frateuria defendens TaxID=2219559 RepID=UPI00066FC52E|nr:ATP-binding protein [Frateuria defendens]
MKPFSLRGRLTWLVIAVQLLVLIPLGLISYQRERREMNELLDGRLAQAGHTLAALVQNNEPSAFFEPAGKVVAPATKATDAMVVSVRNQNFEPEGGFQVYDTFHRLIIATSNLQDLPSPTSLDFGFRDIVHDGTRWRVYTFLSHKGLTVRIGEREDNRQDITRGLMLEHGLPLLLGLPLLAILAGWAVQRGLRPLSLLTQRLAERTPGSRQPVAIGDSPHEIKPLVATLNQQLQRLEDVIEREHRFNADVAHELRTPLTAAVIHLESASLTNNPLDARFDLDKAQQSLARLARRIEQILALARLEAGAAARDRSPMDLVAVATEVIEEMAPLIAGKDIELSLVNDAPKLLVQGHEAALFALFRNLIENALRYASTGGQVEVSLKSTATAAVIDISDDGPGIPADRREVVFDRFHRESRAESPGYGLGLSIVRRAAQLHDARIELFDSTFGHGLHVRITLPLTAQG